MDIEHLVTMVNEIAAFFESEEPATAQAKVTDHLRKFWEPRMRKQIREFAAAGGHGLSDLSARAVKMLQ